MVLRKFIAIGMLFLCGCGPPRPPLPTYYDLMHQCSIKYPFSALKDMKRKLQLKYILEFNECQRQATHATIEALGGDLIDLAYSKKALIYKRALSGQISLEEGVVETNQVDVDLYNSAQQRMVQNRMANPSPIRTHCSTDYAGGMDCRTY